MRASGFLEAYLRQRRAEIDAALARYLPTPPSCPPLISDAMRYSIEAGGKRLRPILTLAAAEAVEPHVAESSAAGGTDSLQLAMPAACALELIHTYSLIHDDLPAMDDDSLRRGRPTAHVVYGEGIAILAGDGLLTEAFAVLAREPEDPEGLLAQRKLRTIAVIAAAAGAGGMVGGQAMDLQAAGGRTAVGATRPLHLDPDSLREMHARKTGALIRAAATAGAIMAGAADGLIAAIDDYAASIGLAFQIIDDILDVEGAAETLGKTAGKDAAAAKPTYPALYGIAESRIRAREAAGQARESLRRAGLSGRLDEIAEWVISRRN